MKPTFQAALISAAAGAFHAKKRDFIEQEIYARMIMYNFSMLITEHIEVPKQKGKHMTQLNITAAIHVCMSYLKSDRIDPAELEKLIARRTLPVRPDRHYKRKNRGRSAVSTEEKRSKQELHKIKGNIIFVLLALIPIIITALAAIL